MFLRLPTKKTGSKKGKKASWGCMNVQQSGSNAKWKVLAWRLTYCCQKTKRTLNVGAVANGKASTVHAKPGPHWYIWPKEKPKAKTNPEGAFFFNMNHLNFTAGCWKARQWMACESFWICTLSCSSFCLCPKRKGWRTKMYICSELEGVVNNMSPQAPGDIGYELPGSGDDLREP